MSNSILDLSFDPEIRADGDKGYASLGFNSELGLDLCHGFKIELGVGANASAGFSQQLGDYLKLALEVEANAEANARAGIQLSPKITQEFGLLSTIAAYAQASVRARLSIDLLIQAILDFNKGKLANRADNGGLAAKVFAEFVKQLEVGIGVEANAQVAATIISDISCRGRLLPTADHKPGFDIRVAAEAALLVGSGAEFFVKARFKSLPTFLQKSTGIVIEHFEGRAIGLNPEKESEIAYAFKVIERASSILITVAQSTSINDLKPVLRASLSELAFDFIVDELLRLYDVLMQHLIDELDGWLDQNADLFSDDIDHEALINEIEKLANTIDQSTDIRDVYINVERSLSILSTLGYSKTNTLKSALTHGYMLHFLITTDQQRSRLADMPDMVKTEYQSATNTTVVRLSDARDACLYLQNAELIDLAITKLGLVGNVANIILDTMQSAGLSLYNLISAFSAPTLPLSAKNIEDKDIELVFDILTELFEQYLAPVVKKQIQEKLEQNRHLAQSSIAREYFDVIIVKTIDDFPKVLLPCIRYAVFTLPNEKVKIPFENLQFLANSYLANFISRNITFLFDFALNQAVATTEDNMTRCIELLRTGEFDQYTKAVFVKLETRINKALPLPQGVKFEFKDDVEDELIAATKVFLSDTFKTGKKALGTATWTQPRIDDLVEGIESVLINIDGGKLDFSGFNDVQINHTIAELVSCPFLPPIKQPELKAMANTSLQIGLDQLKGFAIEMPKITSDYFRELVRILLLRPLREFMDQLQEYARQLLKRVTGVIELLGTEIGYLIDNINDAIKTIDALIDDVRAEIKLIMQDFFTEWRTQISINLFDKRVRNFFFDRRVTTEQEAYEAFRDKCINDAVNKNYETVLLAQAKSGALVEGSLIDDLSASLFDQASLDVINNTEYVGNNSATDVFSVSGPFATALSSNSTEINNVYEKSEKIVEFRKTLTEKENERAESQALEQKLTKRLAELDEPKDVFIKINSPIPMDISEKAQSPHQTPMYGKYMLIDVEFINMRLKPILDAGIHIPLVEITRASMRGEGDLSTSWVTLNDEDTANTLPISISVMLNGKQLSLEQFTIAGSRIRGHVDKSFLANGNNTLNIIVQGPSSHPHLSLVESINFYANTNTKNAPSNALYIDPKKSVFNAPGNDHQSARQLNLSLKERVVITNASEFDRPMKGYKLRDAAGHQFDFSDATVIPANSDFTIYVGLSSPTRRTWRASYRGREIAILNNAGEFLELISPSGRVESQLYHGSPRSNAKIKFVTQEAS
jgi:hypothetical protein